jgi:diaminopimelate decarboxylase/aspartate kinase
LDPSENLVNTDVLAELSADLSQVCRVKVIAPCAAITLVGRGMRSLLHKLSEVWATFGQERVHLISQSSNDLNLTFVIDEADADGLLPVLHAALIDSGAMPVQDAAVFGPSWRALFEPAPRTLREAPWWRAAAPRLLQAAEHGTPRYVYDLDTVRRRARGLGEIAAVDRRFYALKANAQPRILAALEAEGFGFECVSLAEVNHVLALFPQIDRARVLFTPSFAPRAEYDAALAHGVNVTVDNLEALQRWPESFRGRAIWLRVDLGRGDGHHAKVTTGGHASKFGLPLSKVEAFVDAARRLDARIVGLHAHLGSGIETAAHWREVYAELAGIADEIGSVATIDIGGGLPIPYRPDDAAFDLDAWAAGLADIKADYPRYALAIEPGRYLVAEAGVLLVRTTQVVEKEGVRRVGADAGMNALIRPALYDAWHEVHNLSRLDDADTAVFDVVGPICESSDVIGLQRSLPAATAEGDVLLIADAGAYGMSMANAYNLRALPLEEVVS